tara:strand:- start:144 stop:545 length:402 start_codon:yes stop_codon:yes gene_type:complete
MKEKISITYSHQVNDDDTNESKIEYNKYLKLPDDIEKLLTYKKIVKNNLNGLKITNDETFNELYKKGNDVNEVVGYCNNKNDWDVREYTNYNLDKTYKKEYDNIKLDINYDMFKLDVNYDMLENYNNKYLTNK